MHTDDTETQTLLDGRYQLGECIGEGGMAHVHRGEDLALGRTVAIKVLRPGAEGLATPGRARAEMTVLASLSHPSLVTLFDARIAPGRADYLVMEFVDGPTLSERLEQGPLPADEVAQLGAELGEALHVVHSAGIVHRDLKPSNVLLSPAHRPGREYRSKLADFGIAYLLGSDRTTTPGMVVGTAGYLAPEQVRGSAPAPSADIYALGLVLLEALTGQRGFAPASGMEAIVARLSAPPAIPDSVDPEWAGLLREMTAMDADSRPSAIEVSAAAARLVDGADEGAADSERIAPPTATRREPPTLPIPVVPILPPVSPPTPAVGADPDRSRPRRSRPRRPRRVALVGAAAAAATVVAATGFWLVGSGVGAPDPADTAPAVTEPSQVPTVPTDQAVSTDEGGSTDPAVVPVDDGTTPAEEAPAPADEAPAPTEEADDGTGTVVDDGAAAGAQRRAEEAQRKADEAAQRAAEKAQKEAEKAEQKAEADRLREEAEKKP